MYSSRMPVPVWESDSLAYLDGHPANVATVVSDDIWKKFDLDLPLDNYHHRYQNDLLDNGPMTMSSMPPTMQHFETPMMMHFDKLNCQASREIRHHDCMWAGLCISKEHNRTHPAKKDSQIHRRIPAGRSLLINKNNPQQQPQQSQTHSHSVQSCSNGSMVSSGAAHGYQSAAAACRTTTKNLESDGDSTRPETPQSSGESETESEEEEDEDEEEDEVPVFRHEQININDIVSMPVSEVTGQQIQRRPALSSYHPERRKEELTTSNSQKETVIRNTLMSDHSYHLLNQQPSSKKLDHLGVQTPSDSDALILRISRLNKEKERSCSSGSSSEEEIDVVSYEKPTRPVTTAATSSLPTYPSPAEQQHFQLTVNTAFKERHHNNNNNTNISNANTTTSATPVAPVPPAPRPRGRPPSNPNRKRQVAAAAAAAAQAAAAEKPAKRARHHRSYQRRRSPQKSPQHQQQYQQQLQMHHIKSSPVKSSTSMSQSSRSSDDDDEPDTEKRSLHNNMERQRRIELRNAFEDLRVLVPEVEAKEKAPKVAILRQAALYCDRLTDLEQLNQAKVCEMKKRQERLRAQLSQLRRNLAMQR